MKVLFYGSSKPDYYHEGFIDICGSKNISFIDNNVCINGSYQYVLEKGDLDKFDLIIFNCDSFFEKEMENVLKTKTSATKIYIDTDDILFIKNIYKNNEIKFYFKRETLNELPLTQKIEWLIRHTYGLYYQRSKDQGIKNLRANLKYLALPYELGIKTKKLKKLKPFPITTLTSPKKFTKNKQYDLSFIGSLHQLGVRHQYYNNLLKFQNEINNKMLIQTKTIPKQQYNDIISNSKAGVSIRGYGFDTFRYWEIPCLGSLLISQNLPLIIPNNFIDNEHALFFNDFNELKYKFLKYVVNSDEWMEIARKGQERFLEYHTPKKRVQYLLNVIEGNE